MGKHILTKILSKVNSVFILSFKRDTYPNINFNKFSLGVRTSNDFEYIKRLYTTIYETNPDFKIQDVLEFLNKNPELICYPVGLDEIKDNNDNPIYHGKGQELATLAKQVIPNGGSDITKMPNSYLPDIHPAYYVNCSDIEITTLNGIKLKDFGSMSTGSCILGYSDPDVDAAVHDVVERGNISSLNNPTEVKLAKELIRIHQWASFAKFTRSESNALSLAIRIARASTGKHKVLVSGMMSWHDNFLASNLRPVDSKLKSKDPINTQFDNLKVYGVNPKLVDSCTRFNPHNLDALEKLVKKKHSEIGVILMEPATNLPISEFILQKIKLMCNEYNIKLIFNEIKFGFRNNLDGIHLLYKDCYPDLCVLGRSIANGYSLAAVLGNKQMMTVAEKYHFILNSDEFKEFNK